MQLYTIKKKKIDFFHSKCKKLSTHIFTLLLNLFQNYPQRYVLKMRKSGDVRKRDEMERKMVSIGGRCCGWWSYGSVVRWWCRLEVTMERNGCKKWVWWAGRMERGREGKKVVVIGSDWCHLKAVAPGKGCRWVAVVMWRKGRKHREMERK